MLAFSSPTHCLATEEQILTTYKRYYDYLDFPYLPRLLAEGREVKQKLYRSIFGETGFLTFDVRPENDFHPEDDYAGYNFADFLLRILDAAHPSHIPHFTHKNLSRNTTIPGLGKMSGILSKLFRGNYIHPHVNTSIYCQNSSWRDSLDHGLITGLLDAGKPVPWERVFQRYWNVQPKVRENTLQGILSCRPQDLLACSFRDNTNCSELKRSCFYPGGESYGGAPTSLALNPKAAIFNLCDGETRVARALVYILPEHQTVVFGRIYGRIQQSVLKDVANKVVTLAGWPGEKEVRRIQGCGFEQHAPESFYTDSVSFIFSNLPKNRTFLDYIDFEHAPTVCPNCGRVHYEGRLICLDCYRHLIYCSKCHKSLNEEEVYYGPEIGPLCVDCHSEIYFMCPECGGTHQIATAYVLFDRLLCVSCAVPRDAILHQQ